MQTCENLIQCKALFRSEMRRFQCGRTWDALVTKMGQVFSPQLGVGEAFQQSTLLVRYVDEEGDKVTLDSTKELDEALQVAKGGLLRLFIEERNGLAVEPKQEDNLQWEHLEEPAKDTDLQHQLARLCELGFAREKQNVRLLRKLGSIDEVIQVLNERKEKREERCREKRSRRDDEGKTHATHKRSKTSSDEDAPVGASFTELKEWPTGKTHLYVDGNNMLYLTGTLRRFTLSRGGKWKAEATLTSLAEAFGKAMKQSGVESTMIIYDSISSAKCLSKDHEEGGRFTVCSARLEYGTSDDALVAWAKDEPEIARSSVYVTSDRELKNRLVAAGGTVVKPKQWVTFAMRVLENKESTVEEEVGSLDAFVERWSALHIQ